MKSPFVPGWRIPRHGAIAALVLLASATFVGAIAPVHSEAASGPFLKLSRYSGAKGTSYSATYSYVPDQGAGCDFSALLQWDGHFEGGAWTLLGGQGCRAVSSGLAVPYPPVGTPGKHRVCAVVRWVVYPKGVTIPTVCVTFTITASATPKPTHKPTPKPTAKPTPAATPALSPSPSASPSPEAVTPSPTISPVASSSSTPGQDQALMSTNAPAGSAPAKIDAAPTAGDLSVGLVLLVALLAMVAIVGVFVLVARRRGT